MSIKEDYKHQINHTLAGFQILEYSILEYLNLYYLVVSTLLPPELTFNFNVADIKNPSLGNLIPYLSNSLSDESLINDIKSIRKRRNELAHQSFMNLYDGTCSDAELLSRIKDFGKISKKISSINERLHNSALLLGKVLSDEKGVALPDNYFLN